MSPNAAWIAAASNAAKPLDPQTVVGAANSAQSMIGAVGQATATAGFGTAVQQAAQLRGLTPEQQQAAWHTFSGTQQAALRAAGFTPAQIQRSGPGFFGSIVAGVEHAVGAVGHAIGSDVVHPILKGLNEPLSQISHLERAGQVLSEMGDRAAGESWQSIAGSAAGSGLHLDAHDFRLMFSPSAWSQAWRATGNGEASFDPAILHEIQANNSPLLFHVARQLASVPQGTDPSATEAQIVNGFPAAQRLQVVQMIHSDPQLKQVVSQLQNAKLSVGREVVGASALATNPKLHLLSGAIDGALDVAQDPTMHLGAIGKTADALRAVPDAVQAAEAAKWGMTTDQATNYLVNSGTAWSNFVASRGPAADRLYRAIADTANAHGFGALNRIDPRLLKLAEPLAQFHQAYDVPVTADSVSRFFHSTAAAKAVIEGGAAEVTKAGPLFPQLSVLGQAKVAARGLLARPVDFLAERGVAHEKLARDLASARLSIEDLAGKTPDLMAHDGELPATAHDIAPTDLENVRSRSVGGFAAHMVLGGPSAVARTMRRMATLTTSSPTIDLADPGSVTELRRALSYAMPKWAVDQVASVYTSTKDVNQRFNIVKGAIAQMLHLAGVYAADGTGDAADQIMQAMTDSFHGETYAPLGLDKFADGSRAAVFDSQISNKVALPPFREVHAAALEHAYLSGLRVPVNRLAEKVMAIWRPLELGRVAFPERIALEENGGDMLRNGVLDNVAAHVAAKQTRRMAARAARDAIEQENVARLAKGLDPKPLPVAKLQEGADRVFGALADHLPAPMLNAIRTPAQLAAVIQREIASKVASPLMGDLSPEEQLRALEAFNTHAWPTGERMISALHHAGGGYDEGLDLVKTMVNGKPRYMALKTGATHSEVLPGDPFWRAKWRLSLGNLAHSQLGQQVLTDIDKSQRTQVTNVLKLIESDAMEGARSKMKRAWMTPDLKVANATATEAQVHRQWAKTVVATVNAMVRSGDPTSGPVLQDLVSALKLGETPDAEVLDAIPHDQLPRGTYGPELFPVTPVESLIQRGFEPLSKMTDALSRQPIFLHSYMERYTALYPEMRRITGNAETASELAAHVATSQALQIIKPYLHSPELRTQFEVLHRTGMPFLFAQRQFLQRWAKTFVAHPEAIRKLQFLNNGLRQAGIIHTDQNGNEFFYYPGSQLVTDGIARALNAIGIHASIPLSVPFTGQVKYLVPGLNDPITPSAGPTVAVSMKALTHFLPEMQKADTAMLGPGANNSYWDQFMPSTLSRVIHTFADSPDQRGQLASSVVYAIQMLEASGHGLPPTATWQQKQQFINRVTSWARTAMMTKAILGFVAPSSPTASFDPQNFNEKLSTLLNELPYDQALAEFVKEYPDATPYTVFASKSAGGASLPASQAAGTWLNQNSGFVQSYPLASGWLIPQTTGANQKFDISVYREQIQYGMRQEQLPALPDGTTPFLDAVIAAPAAQAYWQAYDTEQAQIKQAGTDSLRKAQIRAAFDQAKTEFLAQNPTLANEIGSSTAKARREQTITELDQALNDPRLPAGPQTEQVRTMMDAFTQYQLQYQVLMSHTGSGSAAAKTRAKESFETAMQNYATAHPEVSALWSNLLRPEVTDTTSGMSDTPSALQLVGA
jgi:hypothetical protein